MDDGGGGGDDSDVVVDDKDKDFDVHDDDDDDDDDHMHVAIVWLGKEPKRPKRTKLFVCRGPVKAFCVVGMAQVMAILTPHV